MFLQQIVQGLAIGSIYGLIALGYVMIWNAWGVLNFAQGEAAMVGAFGALIFHVWLGMPFAMSFLLSIGTASVVGYVVERLAFRPLIRANDQRRLIATIGASILLRNLFRLIFSADPFPFPTVFGDRPMQVGSVLLVPQNLWITGIGFVLVVLLRLLLTRTCIGKAMRAAAQDRETAGLMGIKVRRVMSLTFVLAMCMGAVAGMLVAPVFFVRADMGLTIGLKGFAAAVLGGIESVTGAMVGGLLLGLAENLGAGYISSGYQSAIAFGIMIGILVFRPSGVMGRRL